MNVKPASVCSVRLEVVAYEKVLLLSICGGVHAAENFNLLLSSCTRKQHLFECNAGKVSCMDTDGATAKQRMLFK